jgi:hypothetical protein
MTLDKEGCEVLTWEQVDFPVIPRNVDPLKFVLGHKEVRRQFKYSRHTNVLEVVADPILSPHKMNK